MLSMQYRDTTIYRYTAYPYSCYNHAEKLTKLLGTIAQNIFLN